MTVALSREPLRVRPDLRREVKVLVVEDDSEMRAALRDTFLLRGFLVNTAADGIKALLLSFRDRYDAVVCDIRLPRMNGIDVARSLSTLTFPPKVILITAYPEWKVYEEAYAAGAAEVIRKPFQLSALADTVNRLAGSGGREP